MSGPIICIVAIVGFSLQKQITIRLGKIPSQIFGIVTFTDFSGIANDFMTTRLIGYL